jgi:hypothetical protein
MDDDRVFELRKDGELLGTLIEIDLDFPWYICQFEASPAFASYKSLFKEGERFLAAEYNQEEWHDWYGRVREQGLIIIQLHDGKIADKFTLYIYGEKSHFRAVFRDK